MSTDWQPIETAPKDHLLLLYGVYPLLWGEDTDSSWFETGYWNESYATHWMPIPAPPRSET